MKFTKHWKREHLWCCISGSAYKGVRYSRSWDLDVQIVISWSLSPRSLQWFSSYLTNQKQPKPLVRMNYPKLFPLLSGFHKETSRDRYFFYVYQRATCCYWIFRGIIVCWRDFSLMLRKRSSTAGEQVTCTSLQTNNAAKREQNYIEPFKDQIHVNRKQ